LQHKSSDNPSILANPIGNTLVDAVFNGLSGNDLTVFLKVIVSFSKFFHCPVFECALIIKNELFPIILCEKSKRNICHFSNLLQQKSSAAKGFLSQLFRAHSTSYPTGGLQSFRFTIPYATAYRPPMTNIQYFQQQTPR
jgi:hypothetical protein